MDISAISAAASILSNALATTRSAREIAKASSDLELKGKISDVYDALLEVKESVFTLAEENRNLTAQLAQKIKVVGPFEPPGYFYMADDAQRQNPLCPSCFQNHAGTVSFMQPARGDRDGSYRVCHGENHHVIHESTNPFPGRSYIPSPHPYWE